MLDYGFILKDEVSSLGDDLDAVVDGLYTDVMHIERLKFGAWSFVDSYSLYVCLNSP
jgi:hypothetical protein